MSRIAQRRAQAKRNAIPCCICKQEHPEDQTNHRMREHEHQGRRCLGGDIPFAEHGRPATGKLYIGVFPQKPRPNLHRALQLAEGRYARRAIGAVLKKQPSGDPHVLWWIEEFMRADQERKRAAERRAT